MPEYRLFSWGANSHGQLGLGEIKEEELPTPREVDLTSAGLRAENVKKIVGGAGHTLLLDESGELYSCGWNAKGQTGIPNGGPRFQKLDGFEGRRIVDVVCGWNSSMALVENGEVFVWGSNSHGQLGSDTIAIGGKIDRPLKLELDVPLSRISMGLRHSAVITQDSRVLVSGAVAKGQLGIDVSGSRFSNGFLQVPNLEPVIDVSCGQHYTMVITENNDLYAWGDNKHGQLGIDPSLLGISLTPIKIESVDACKKIYCGWTHSVILTHSKEVFAWGRNSYGQLGRPEASSKINFWKRETPLLSTKIGQLSIGSEHNIALTDDGRVLSWGWNEHGNCGNGSTDDIFVPTQVNLPEGLATLVGSGAGHSFAVVKMNC